MRIPQKGPVLMSSVGVVANCRRIDDDRNVIVECIYEPPQSATADSLQLERGTEEEQRADYIAELLGYISTSVAAYALATEVI